MLRRIRLSYLYSIHWDLLMLCLVILTPKHEHWESNFEINLALFMKATFNTDRNTKLARALLTRVMIILRDQLAQLFVWLNNKRRWCNSKEEINFRVIIILVSIDECWDKFSAIFHRDAFVRIKTSRKRICWEYHERRASWKLRLK